MPSMEAGQLYHIMSRKELQKLCKKLGLPARKPSSVMAESLRSYFQKQDGHCSMPITTFGGSLSSSLPSEQSDTPLCSHNGACADGSQSCYDVNKINKLGEIENLSVLKNCSLNSTQLEIVHKCPERSDTQKGSLSNGDLKSKSCCMSNKEGPCISESSSQLTKGSVSFEFYAASEEGINICIDLNSRPSDWIKKYNEEVICENVNSKKMKLDLNSCATTSGGAENSNDAGGFVSRFLNSDTNAENFFQNEISTEKTACNFKHSCLDVEQNSFHLGDEECENGKNMDSVDPSCEKINNKNRLEDQCVQ